MKFTSRIERMEPSATTAMANKARLKKEQGYPVISFSTGEPDYTSPKPALEYAKKAMDDGHTHYTSTSGINELKQAVADYYRSRFDISYPVSEVVIGTGAKQLLYEALGCIVEEAKEVIVIAPAWVSYVEQIRLFDGIPVIVNTENTDFVPTIEAINEKININTVAIIINSPNNPTGVVYTADFLKDLAHLAMDRDLLIINDEVYERLVFGNRKYCQIMQAAPEAREHVININGASKSYAMTGWRLGFALGPKELMEKIVSFQSHLTSNTSTISQWAALGALKEAQSDVEWMRQNFERRRLLILGLLDEMPLISYTPPDGAFYVFVNIKKCLGMKFKDVKITDDIAFCEILLDSKNIALVPGTAFLMPGFFRIAYSVSDENIIEGMSRLKEFLSEMGN